MGQPDVDGADALERRRTMSNEQSTPEANEAFLELGKIVLGDQPLAQILDTVVHLAKRALAPPLEVSITLVSGDEPVTVGFTGDVALALDERQYEAERGPCLDAGASGERILIADMATETRWPRLAEAAKEVGVRSSASIPLPVQRQATGALNFYAKDADAFDEQTLHLAEMFAAHAAIAVANAHLYESISTLAEQMQQAMATRAVIEQAKGIVMRDNNCTAQEAFDRLVRLSQESHYKLRDIAQLLVDQVSGAAPSKGAGQ